MKACLQFFETLAKIFFFGAELTGSSSLSQLEAHKKYTIDLIDIYLKTVCQIYAEQRAIRVKQVVEKKRA